MTDESPKYVFDDIESLQRNRELEGETGVELGLPGDRTLIVLAASDANPRWRQRSEAFRNELNRLQNARAPADKVRAFLANTYATTLIKGWRGIKSNGVDIPYSPEACTAFLLAADDAFAVIADFVYETKNFRASRVEAVIQSVGN